MSSLIEYRKEFEEIILKGKLEEALKTLVPNSNEQIYLLFCEEYKKCCSEKKITQELNDIIQKAKANNLSNKLIQVLETKRDLLEYDLPSTSKEKKDKILDELYRIYCGVNLNYNPPFFATEKKSQDGQKVEKNNTPIELTEKIIQEAIEKDKKSNEKNKKAQLINTPENKRIKLFLEFLEKDIDECISIVNSPPIVTRERNKKARVFRNPHIPYYLMKKDEFSKVIKFFNEAKKNMNNFDFNSLTIEQAERILKEVNNEKYLDKSNLVKLIINKKYIKLIKSAKIKNELNEVKNILLEMQNIAKDYYIEYLPQILLCILKINKEQNILDVKAFTDYMQYAKKKNIKRIDYQFDSLFGLGEMNKEKFIDDLIIDFFIYGKTTPEELELFFDIDKLKKLEITSKLYKGEEIKADCYSKYLKDSEYEEILKKTEITICEHNAKEFKIDDEVKIDFNFKNVKEININIFEINTENYYVEKQAPLTSLINIEGIIASKTMDIKIEGGENPLKRIRKTIIFDQIPKSKPGVYLIEIIGNGISSRIIIKKGKLSLITRNTSKGILCQIINEKNEVQKDDKTYLWYNGNKFTCEQKEGYIILPYKTLVGANTKCIIVHDSYADITEIKRRNENIELKGYFNFINESLIPGNMLKVNFKPLLFANGREMSLELIKNGTISVEILKSENNESIPVNTAFENITFKDDNKEYEFEVLIPPMMTQMKFKFNCEVTNSNGEKKSLAYEQNSNFESSNNIISSTLFHKIGKKYFYEVIGKNGESITKKAGTHANIQIKTNYYLKEVNIDLQYDEKGKLNLGELKNVNEIKLDNIWYKLNELSKYCYPERIDLIEGESFSLPVYSSNKISLDDNYFQLYQYYNYNSVSSVKDIKKEIILKEIDINGDKDHYYEFTLGENLLEGKYNLSFGNDNERKKIKIRVTKGIHWLNLENYIINDKRYVENSQIKTPIYMKSLKIDKEKGEIKFECSKTKRDIKFTHANIYLSQYQIPQTDTYFNNYCNLLNDGVENLVKSEFTKWKNIYLSNRVLNEEIQYVLQRRNLDNQMGNSLPMPSLLLKRAYRKDCTNEEEKLEKGNEYAKMEEGMGSGATGSVGRGIMSDTKKSFNNDFYNFLKYSGYSLNNIEPININSKEETAKFEIKFNDKEKDILKKYSYIQIILIDRASICSDFHCLCEDNDKFEIEKRNISNEKAIDRNKNISEIKKTELIKKGEKFNINETSNYKLIDSVQKLSKFYLLKLDQKDQYWDKFKFILNINEDKFNEEEFIEKYNEVCGHEVNLFLYFKYPKIFNKYIKDMIKFKFEKTFIDYFLLDDYETLLQYITPLKIKLLSTDELCLLMLKIINKKPDEAAKIKDIIKSRVEKPEDVENLILSNFNIMMNMRIEEEEKIEFEEEECLAEEECPMEAEYPVEEECFMANNIVNECYIEKPKFEPPPCGSAPRFLEEKNCDADFSYKKKKKKMKFTQADFLNQEKTKEFEDAFEKAKEEMGAEFEKPGVAKEYKERHYYIKEHKSEIKNPIWLDFAEHIILNKSHENFLSKYVLYNNIRFNEYLLILSIIGLPIESIKHEYKRVPNSRLISIIPANNLILFTKELTETQVTLNNKLLISQNIIDELHHDMNVNTDNCSIGINYSHQTIVTNISNKSISFQLFIQIPQGSICLNSTYYTNSIKMKLKPYETQNYKIYFYFPKEGEFKQYHPLACKNSNIISTGNGLLYKVKKEYVPSKKYEVVENNRYSKDMRIEGKLRNILSDDSVDGKKKIENIINYFKNDIFNDEDIRNILYLLKENKDFYNELIKTLRARGYYDGKVWSFGFHHKDEKAIKEFLTTNNSIKNDLGYNFTSSLYSYNEIDDAKLHPHLEYSPLYNARKHPFGNKNNKSETNIANKEFNETYRKFIIDLLSLKQLSIKEKLQLIYYLILQDRMDEAFDIYKKIKKEEITDDKNKSYIVQYDYITAYLDFCFGYPDFKLAKSICNKYKDFPLVHWREKFEEIEDQLFEYEGKEKISMDKLLSENDNKKMVVKELREKEPKLSFTINNKEKKILLIHSNISEIYIKFYFIDLETMFTRDPKISEIMNKDNNNKDNDNNYMKDHFGFVQANYSETIKIPEDKINKNDNSTDYKIPKEFMNKNLLVEIRAESIKLFDIYLSSNLYIVITESLGELKVIDINLKAITKAYVKVYVELNDNNVQFYKDGYTDLNGKFNYLALNTDQLKKAKKFYIFVSEEKQGAIIKECYPPKNIHRTGEDNLLSDIQKHKQIQRNQWRQLNKI